MDDKTGFVEPVTFSLSVDTSLSFENFNWYSVRRWIIVAYAFLDSSQNT